LTQLTHWSIGRKLMTGCAGMGVVAATLAAVSLVNIGTLGGLFENAATVEVKKLDLVESIDLAVAEALSLERGELLRVHMHNLPGARSYHSSMQEECRKLRGFLAALKPLVETEQGKQGIAELESAEKSFSQSEDKMWELARTNKLAEAEKIYVNDLPLTEQMRKSAQDLVVLYKQIIEDRVQSGHGTISRTRWISVGLVAAFVLLAVALMLFVFASIRVLKRITSELSETQSQIGGAATQVAASSASLAQGASEQAASLEQTSASVEEISSMTRKNAENSQSAASVMTAVDRQVQDGNRTLEQMVESMQEINASSEKISRIIKVIDEIAFQTNILALNAAVEAARAGEAGMGFAVVADEVRHLAQRSAQAAKDTASLIEDSISKSNQGSERLREVSQVIGAITASAAKVKTLVDEVNLGSQEQARGIEEISKAVVQMNQVTQSTAGSAEESASASEELSAQAGAMGGVLERLRVIVTGGVPGGAAPQAARPEPAAAAVKPAPAAVKVDRSALPLDDNFTEF